MTDLNVVTSFLGLGGIYDWCVPPCLRVRGGPLDGVLSGQFLVIVLLSVLVIEQVGQILRAGHGCLSCLKPPLLFFFPPWTLLLLLS